MSFLRAVVLLSCILTVGCSGDKPAPATQTIIDTLPSGTQVFQNIGPGKWGKTSEWRLESENKSAEFAATGVGAIWDIAADSTGRFYIAEPRIPAVTKFGSPNATGILVGRAGDGPGEYRFPSSMQIDPEGDLLVFDNLRISVYGPDGEFKRILRRSKSFGARPGWIVGKGDRIEGRIRFTAPSVSVYDFGMVDSTGSFLDSISIVVDPLAAPSRTLSPPKPFSPWLSFAFDGGEALWFSYSNKYLLTQVSLRGDTIRTVSRDVATVRPTAAEISAAQQAEIGFAKDVGLPPTETERDAPVRPMIAGLIVDPLGYLWVVRTGSHDEVASDFDVFTQDGHFLGTVVSPVDLAVRSMFAPSMNPSPIRIVGNRLYGVHRDTDGLEHVVILRIVR